eukprot:CAMPEP_0170144250 /NCGR_PEP_ID=MMETSP0033_2-20121228/13382_1 /TAXON_ID=195969 /ORGANISM="Dolichomastix tenuilepis, Strain CCMP3274" /LENGTH=283 /DNA_ID=CAMNT_0010380741 /DNA_START=11 /DNA_END=862 /DNA_ORIENTATION=-
MTETAGAGALRERFEEEGYLVLEGFASADEVQALRRRAAELVEAWDPAERLSVFSTGENQTKTTDHYFLESANTVSFFLEEKAVTGSALTVDKSKAVNKIGHALHDLDPVFRGFTRSAKVGALLRELGCASPTPVQSMYIWKPPGIGGEVVPHQDSTFLHTEPTTCLGLWWALEDATKENGCLWASPRSHLAGVQRRFVRTSEGGVTFDKDVPAADLTGFTPLEVKAGALVVLHGANVHYSAENTSSASREAYSAHFVESSAVWSPDNWLQRAPDFPFEPLTV